LISGFSGGTLVWIGLRKLILRQNTEPFFVVSSQNTLKLFHQYFFMRQRISFHQDFILRQQGARVPAIRNKGQSSP